MGDCKFCDGDVPVELEHVHMLIHHQKIYKELWKKEAGITPKTIKDLADEGDEGAKYYLAAQV